MTTPLRVGVVGLGQRAAIAQLIAASDTDATVAACADPAPGSAARAAALFGDGVPVFSSHGQLIASGAVDALMVLTPDDMHARPALDALRAGLPVFVEKPLAISVADCDEMLEVARATGTRLYVGHNLRHLPMLRAMRSLIEEGAIGAVKAVWCRHFVGHGGDYYFKDWHADRSRTLSLLLQKGAHDLDVLHWLAGAPSERVVAVGALSVYGDPAKRRPTARADERVGDWFDVEQWPPRDVDGLHPVVDVEDISMLTATLTNGTLVSYQQCHYTPDYWRNYTVIGDAGRLENFGDGVTGDPCEVRVWNTRRSGYRSDADLVVRLDGATGDAHGGADAALVAEFLRFARDGGGTETSPVAAREAVAAGVAATQSLRGGSMPVEVSRLDEGLVSYFASGQR